MLIHKPKELSWEEAAGIPEVSSPCDYGFSIIRAVELLSSEYMKLIESLSKTWITATQAIWFVGEFSSGKSILWHAGASSVSIAGIQLSRTNGASAIYVTASSQEKIDFCVKELGATAGFNYKTQNWSEEILKATGGKGVDLVVDFIGASYFQGNINVAARDGRIVTLGLMGGAKLPKGVDISPILFKRLRYEGTTLRSRDEEYQGKLRNTLVEHALEKFKEGCYKVYIEKVFPWEQVVDAHKLMETNQTKGKIICTIG